MGLGGRSPPASLFQRPKQIAKMGFGKRLEKSRANRSVGSAFHQKKPPKIKKPILVKGWALKRRLITT